MNIDILQKFSKKLYSSEPFPNFQIENCLPEKIYDILDKEYEIFENFFKENLLYNENNIRLQISADEFFQIKTFNKSLWHDFILYHTSREFLDKIIDIFYNDLKIYFPNISFEKLDLEKCGLRNDVNNSKKNFVLDCQPGINTKVTSKKSVRGAHVDNPHELIGGLFYFKNIKDNSGGDLKIFKTNKKIYFHQKAEVYNERDIQLYKTIKYQPNNVFFFVNSPISIHSVTERNRSEFMRRLTNIIVERYIDGYNFRLPRKKNFFQKIVKYFYR
tara:strand:+ start:1366 stop:2184 length:819 start_codon:yes stop_codon:yes gene_type:complete